MAIQRLTAFEAEADIAGRLRHVRYDADAMALSIEAISVDEATVLLDLLSTGDLESVKAGALPVAKAMPATEKEVLSKPVEKKSKAKTPAKRKVKTSVAEKAKELAAEKAEAAKPKEVGTVADDVSAGVEEEPEYNETPPPAKAATGDELQELKEASKLRDVIGIMYDEMGIRDPDAILAKCEELQEEIPALKRIKTSLTERVKRTIEVLKIGT